MEIQINIFLKEYNISMLFRLYFFYLFITIFTSTTMPNLHLVDSYIVPNSISLGQDTCMQIEQTSNRIFRLGKSNVINSWFKNGSGYIQKTTHQVNPWVQNIFQIAITPNQSILDYTLINTGKSYQLSTNDFSQVLYMDTFSTLYYCSIVKTSTRYWIAQSLNPNVDSIRFNYMNIANVTWGTGYFPPSNTPVWKAKIKTSLDQNYLLLYHSTQWFALYRIGSPVPQMIFNNPGTSLTSTTTNQPIFSPDSKIIVFQFDNIQNFLVIDLTISAVTTNISMPFVIQKVQFINSGNIIAIFHDFGISYYDITTSPMTLISSTTAGSFSQFMKIDRTTHQLFQCSTGQIKVFEFSCPPQYEFNISGSLECNPINIKNDKIYQTFFQFIQSILKNENLLALNAIPGARHIFRPIFAFFINFDDIQLYNYREKTYDSSVQQTFDSIQVIEKEKWIVQHYETLKNLFQQESTIIKSYFSKIQLNYTSNKFYQIQDTSNGFFSNTVHFYMANIWMTGGIFFTFKLIFKYLEKRNNKMKQWFEKYDSNIFLFCMLFQGNIQHFSYLFGFQIQNLWASSSNDKYFKVGILSIFFFVIITSSSLYLTFIYVCKKKASKYFENYKTGILASIYMGFCFGIRNLILGLSHYFLPESIKCQTLLAIQIIFLAFHIVFLRLNKKQTIYKNRAFMTQLFSFVRILLILVFCVDKSDLIKSSDGYYLFSNFSKVQMIIILTYMSIWILAVFIEIIITFAQLKHFLPSKCSKKLILNQQPEQKSKLYQNKNKQNIKLQYLWKSKATIHKNNKEYLNQQKDRLLKINMKTMLSEQQNLPKNTSKIDKNLISKKCQFKQNYQNNNQNQSLNSKHQRSTQYKKIKSSKIDIHRLQNVRFLRVQKTINKSKNN